MNSISQKQIYGKHRILFYIYIEKNKSIAMHGRIELLSICVTFAGMCLRCENYTSNLRHNFIHSVDIRTIQYMINMIRVFSISNNDRLRCAGWVNSDIESTICLTTFQI